MPSDPASNPPLETAHVLFMDIVGYSAVKGIEAQRLLEELQELVRELPDFRRADAAGDLLRLPTGDGMALVFFRDPVAPLQCAMQLASSLRSRPHLGLRMGLHSGPVYRMWDINANANVSGGGINTAQRVMDCGDAGHILLSNAFREMLDQVGAWPLHDLGDYEVKHGRVRLFNLYTEELGNPELPVRLRTHVAAPRREPGASADRPPGPTRVVLLYKRNAEPDEQLLKLLETRLAAGGCRVFVDRHLAVGVEWAKEIERQLRTADAVVALLSEASIHSEMLAYEVQMAAEAAQLQGYPRLLPVRVGYSGPLPEPLAAVLDPLEYALWSGAEDDEPLVTALLRTLEEPLAAPSQPLKLEPVGGAVPLDSRFYVVRPTDDEFRAAIARRDSIVLVKGSRQMGKTSLLARGLQQARQAGARIVLTDFQKLNAAHLESAESLFLALGDWIADQLDLDVLPEQVWSARRGPSVNFERYLRREALAKLDAHLVWGMDEIDRLFTCSFASEVFGLFRSWHNERALDPAGPWSRLTLAIAYATEAHLFITDLNQSPFNVGTRLALSDFTFEQVGDLNRRYGAPLRDEVEAARYYRLVSGHPYLVRQGLHQMAAHGVRLDAFDAQADRDEGIFGDHLRRIFISLTRDPELCEAVRSVLKGGACPSPESFYRLRGAGILAGDSSRDARLRCRLYATYLSRHLL